MKMKSAKGQASLRPNDIVELYRLAATDLPNDVENALKKGYRQEKKDSLSQRAIRQILDNVKVSREKSVPLCQDTGTPVFYVNYPSTESQAKLKKVIINATKMATKSSILRSNAVDPVTEKNTNTNIGIEFPVIYFEEWNKNYVQVDLLLKGGGSENVGKTYSLPDLSLVADRSLDGVRKCVFDAVQKAQGRGCAPEIVSIVVGGSKDVIAKLSKKQLLRKVGDKNPNSKLNEFEKKLIGELNKLNIGPSGFGGKTTVLDVKVSMAARHVASYFVDVSFNCWALRRKRLIFRGGKASYV